jgi:hypothetical protein
VRQVLTARLAQERRPVNAIWSTEPADSTQAELLTATFTLAIQSKPKPTRNGLDGTNLQVSSIATQSTGLPLLE